MTIQGRGDGNSNGLIRGEYNAKKGLDAWFGASWSRLVGHSGTRYGGEGAVSAEYRSDQSDPKRTGLANRTIERMIPRSCIADVSDVSGAR